MLKIIKIMSIWYMLLFFESYSMIPEFNSVVTENATNKQHLFERLKAISVEDSKNLAKEYIALYGDNELTGEDRKKTLATIDPLRKNMLAGAAAYVVKSLFSQAKMEIYEMDTLSECIRVANLLLKDAPQLVSNRSIDNIANILQAATYMLQERKAIKDNIGKLYTTQFVVNKGLGSTVQ